MGKAKDVPPLPDVHGARELPCVEVEGYSLQLRNCEGFIGDQASQTAFRELLERWRRRRRRKGRDPLGARRSRDLPKETLDEAIGERASEASGGDRPSCQASSRAKKRTVRSQASWAQTASYCVIGMRRGPCASSLAKAWCAW